MRFAALLIYIVSMIVLSWANACRGIVDTDADVLERRACEMVEHGNAVCAQEQQTQADVPPQQQEVHWQLETKISDAKRDLNTSSMSEADREGNSETDDPPPSSLQQRREDELRQRELVMLHLEIIEHDETLKNAAKIRRIQMEEQQAAERSLPAQAALKEGAERPPQGSETGDGAEGQTRGDLESTPQVDFGVLSEEQQQTMQAEADAVARAYLDETP